MTVKSCEKVEKSQVELTIEVNAAEFEAAVEKAYQKMRRKISVPGFRPGKAPRKMIERMYGAEVFFEEAINIAFPEAYEAAAEQEKLQIVGYPAVEMVGEVTKDGFTFKATTPVYPEVTLGEYKGLKAEKPEVKVLAVYNQERLEGYPDVPTMGELGYYDQWLGSSRCIVAPAGTPENVIKFYEDAFQKLMEDADYLKAAEAAGMETDYKNSADTAALIKQQQDFTESLADVWGD